MHCNFNDFVCPTATKARSRRKRLFRELSNPNETIAKFARMSKTPVLKLPVPRSRGGKRVDHRIAGETAGALRRGLLGLSKVQSVDQRTSLGCGVGFRQLRTCRRIRPGQLLAKTCRSRCSNAPLFDHLVGALLQTQGHFDAERDDLSPASAGLFLRAQVRSDENNERSVSGWPLMPEPLCASPRWRARTLRRKAISNKLAPHAVSDRGLSEGRYRTTLIAWGVPSGTRLVELAPLRWGFFVGWPGQKKAPGTLARPDAARGSRQRAPAGAIGSLRASWRLVGSRQKVVEAGRAKNQDRHQG